VYDLLYPIARTNVWTGLMLELQAEEAATQEAPLVLRALLVFHKTPVYLAPLKVDK
jgi:hypothetical protein